MWDEIKISRSSGLTTKGSKEMREFLFLQVLEPPHFLSLTNRLALSYSISEERKAFPVSFQNHPYVCLDICIRVSKVLNLRDFNILIQ